MKRNTAENSCEDVTAPVLNWSADGRAGGSEEGDSRTLLTVREVSRILRVSATCVYALVGSGRLACYRVGTGRGAIRIRRQDVGTYLAACRVEEQAPAPKTIRPRLKHLKLPHAGPVVMEGLE